MAANGGRKKDEGQILKPLGPWWEICLSPEGTGTRGGSEAGDRGSDLHS